VLIHLIRHAHAGARSKWDGPDLKRPLSKRGAKQAELIAKDLSGAGIDLFWSSEYVRCSATLVPLAKRADKAVILEHALTEHEPGPKALDVLLAAAARGKTVAACSHGDVIPAIVDEAVRRGAKLRGPSSCSKGARYELKVKHGKVAEITHVPAPDGDH
jgi:broad specificity phosphatase PhoE